MAISERGLCPTSFQSAKVFHRVQCVEVIDACVTAIQQHFDQETYSVLTNIETMLINAANRHTFELNDTVKCLYKDDLDFDQLSAELKLLEGIVSHQLPEVKMATSIDTITSIFPTEETNIVQIILAVSDFCKFAFLLQ